MSTTNFLTNITDSYLAKTRHLQINQCLANISGNTTAEAATAGITHQPWWSAACMEGWAEQLPLTSEGSWNCYFVVMQDWHNDKAASENSSFKQGVQSGS
jgi:hypothetical protein